MQIDFRGTAGTGFPAVSPLSTVERYDDASRQSCTLGIGSGKASFCAHFGYLYAHDGDLGRILVLHTDGARRHCIYPPTYYSISQER